MIEYFLIFSAGVMGSMHCLGMCGGFPIAISSVPKKCRIKTGIAGAAFHNTTNAFASDIRIEFLVRIDAAKDKARRDHAKHVRNGANGTMEGPHRFWSYYTGYEWHHTSYHLS